MKNRAIPFGYKYIMGKPVAHEKEAAVVKWIFEEYLAQTSMKKLADSLTKRKVEYLPGRSQWDKARIKRLLENQRYMGKDGFPVLVDPKDFQRVKSVKQNNCTAKEKPDEQIEFLKDYMVCDVCGKQIARRQDKRLRAPVYWLCTSCEESVGLDDQKLKTSVKALLTKAAQLYSQETQKENEPVMEIFSLDSRRIEQDIHRRMDAGNADEEELLNMILECAAKTYEAIKSVRHISDRMAADFAKADPLSPFNQNLFQRTVRRIRLTHSGKVKLELQDGNIVTGEDWV